MVVVRYLDLVVLAVAFPIFVVADFPLLGYAAATLAWLLQRGVQALLLRRATAAQDVRGAVGIAAASMIGRGYLVALTIFGAGLIERKAGLAAAILATDAAVEAGDDARGHRLGESQGVPERVGVVADAQSPTEDRGHEVQVVAPRAGGGRPEPDAGDGSQRRKHVGAGDHVIDRLGVRRMQPEQGGAEEGAPVAVQDPPEQEGEEQAFDQEPGEAVDVKGQGIESAQGVVDRKRRRHHRPITLIGRQRAEGAHVGEEARDIAQVADEQVALDRMRVVEMERVAEVVRVR